MRLSPAGSIALIVARDHLGECRATAMTPPTRPLQADHRDTHWKGARQ
jgi:hypothetical protein